MDLLPLSRTDRKLGQRTVAVPDRPERPSPTDLISPLLLARLEFVGHGLKNELQIATLLIGETGPPPHSTTQPRPSTGAVLVRLRDALGMLSPTHTGPHQLVRWLDELVAAQATIEAIAAHVHHELERTGQPADAEDLRQVVLRSAASVAELRTLVHQQPVEPRLEPTVVDLQRWHHDTLTVSRRAARRSGLELHFEAPTTQAVALPLSRRDLDRLVDNLVSNALKATRAGTITIRAQVAPDTFTVEVEDPGAGIASPELRRLLAVGATSPDTSDPVSNGRGLASVHAVLRSCGGRLEARSRPGQGSTFRLILATPGEAMRPTVSYSSQPGEP